MKHYLEVGTTNSVAASSPDAPLGGGVAAPSQLDVGLYSALKAQWQVIFLSQ